MPDCYEPREDEVRSFVENILTLDKIFSQKVRGWHYGEVVAFIFDVVFYCRCVVNSFWLTNELTLVSPCEDEVRSFVENYFAVRKIIFTKSTVLVFTKKTVAFIFALEISTREAKARCLIKELPLPPRRGKLPKNVTARYLTIYITCVSI